MIDIIIDEINNLLCVFCFDAGTLRRESCRTLCLSCEPVRWMSGPGARNTGPCCRKHFCRLSFWSALMVVMLKN